MHLFVSGPSGLNTVAAEPRASSSRSPGKTVIVRAVSHSTYLGDFFLSKLHPTLQLDVILPMITVCKLELK